MIMAMKESGIEWVGLIPDTWSVIPNKYVMHKEKNLCKKWTGEEVMSLTMNGVIVRDLQNPTGKMPATFDGYQYIEDGDLLMCLFDIDVTPRCVGKVTYDGVTSPAYSNFKVHDNASRDYFYYYYLMVDNTKELLHLAKNLRHSFTEEQLGQLKVPMPPLSEQKVIADYLDETCSQIDEIIAEAKKSIDEYKELKQSVIFEAVTKGLDKDVEMKNSEVEGMGFIPKKWSVVRFMKVNYVRARLGWKGLKAEEYIDVGYPFLAAYHIVKFDTNIRKFIYFYRRIFKENKGGKNKMIKDIMKDPLFLAQKSTDATKADQQVVVDLLDTLRANLDHCVGMAANMIGVKKNIIVVAVGPFQFAMINPKITKKSGIFETEEGCLSLDGVRPCKRYKEIEVDYLDQNFKKQHGKYSGWTAQIIQHEIDHCKGIVI